MSERTEMRRGGWRGRRGLAPLLFVLASGFPVAGQDLELISIGTGGETGVYYLTGGAICAMVNKRRWDTGMRCLTEPSAGSIQNLRDVRAGARTFGIVQSDWQFHAENGTNVFSEAGPDRDLRSVLSLFREPFTVITRPGTGIVGLNDLKEKRVSLGPAGSGGRATMGVVMEALDWTDADFAWTADFAMPDVPRALCAGDIDAAVFIVAHPNLAVEEMISTCDAALVPVSGPEIEKMVAENPYFTPDVIAADSYAGQSSDAPTFALTATLITSSRTSPLVVSEVTRAVIENLDAFRATHPALTDLDGARMFSEGMTAPPHEGVLPVYLPDEGR